MPALPPIGYSFISFNAANGLLSTGGLLADAAGDLFGTTMTGGPNGLGSLFEIQPTGGVLESVR